MSVAGYVIAVATLISAGLVIFWVTRADEAETSKPTPTSLRARGDESLAPPDDPTTSLRKAVEAGEAAARQGKGQDGS